MRIGAAFGWAIFGGLVIVACGSSSSDGGTAANACTPGASVACTGTGGCTGAQVCAADGSGLGSCDCGSKDSGAPPSDSGVTDSGASNNDSGDADTWLPTQLTGLDLWVEGSKVDAPDAAALSSWPDQSPLDASLSPRSGDPRVHHAAIGGLDAVNFAFPSDVLEGNAPSLGTGPFIVEVVSNPGACASSCTLFLIDGLLGDTAPACTFALTTTGTSASAKFQCAAPDSANISFTAGPHLFGFRRTSTSSAEVRVDGTASVFTLAGESASTASPQFYLGTLEGDIAEVVVATAPSDGDVTQLETYLKSKYGL